MATQLLSDVVRESSEMVDERNIIITLTETQEITMKLKGMKSGQVGITITELYNQLTGGVKPKKGGPVSVKRSVDDKSDPMISLSRLRSLNMTTPGDTKLLTRLDELIKEFIELDKKTVGA